MFDLIVRYDLILYFLFNDIKLPMHKDKLQDVSRLFLLLTGWGKCDFHLIGYMTRDQLKQKEIERKQNYKATKSLLRRQAKQSYRR